ncbi:MAG: MBOAT family protein [Coriobacteriia bacterium]|nr:MBOAT family protein [Coriobacteriia bacterium]
MLFNTYTFVLLFLPVVLGLLALFRIEKLRWAIVPFLGLASLAFYAYWDIRYVPILLGSIVFNFAVGRALTGAGEDAGKRRALLIAGIALDLILLGYFKYVGFFVGNVNAVLGTSLPVFSTMLPLGISFFTFTQIEYLVDASRGKAERYSFTDYLLFVSFFPHLIAGPILRHDDVIPQFGDELRRWSDTAFATGCLFFAVGLFKKVMIADMLAPWADYAFANIAGLGTLSAWLGALSYTMQLYFDFSGYSDMAVGLAFMLNVRIPVNFDSPYKSASIVEFWRRWHITLSRFLREYLYFPLGGNRKGPTRTTVNLILTFLLGGLWHGAGWTFIAWGGWHGVLLALNHAWRRAGRTLPRFIGLPITFLAVVAGWVLFRAPSMAAALDYFAAMVGRHAYPWPEQSQALSAWLPVLTGFTKLGATWTPATIVQVPILAALLVFVLVLPNTQELAERMKARPLWAAFIVVAFIVPFLYMGGRVTHFLYYQF